MVHVSMYRLLCFAPVEFCSKTPTSPLFGSLAARRRALSPRLTPLVRPTLTRTCSSQALKAHPGLRLFSACAIKDCSAHFAYASFATAVIDGLFSSRSSRLSNSPRLTHSLHSCSLASHLILRYPEDPEPPDPSSKESSTTPPPPPPDPPNSLLTGS